MAEPKGNTSTLCGLETNLIEQILVSKLYQCLLAKFQVCLYVVLEMKLQLSMWLPWWLSGKEPPAVQESRVQFLDREDPLEKEIATHSSILAWKILWTEEPDGPYSPWVTKKSDTT